MQIFLNINNLKNKNMPKQPINKKKTIRKMRTVGRSNPDGTTSTHLMSWAGDTNKKRGNFAVFPTIAPKAGKGNSSNPNDWADQNLEQAKKRGELIEVKSQRKAEKLAAGSWKKGQDKKDAMKDYRQNKKAEKKITKKK